MDVSGTYRHRKVEVFFIRHAESEENVRVRHVVELLQTMLKAQIPSIDQLLRALAILRFDWDAELSQEGRRQLQDLKLILNSSDRWARFKFDCAVYSPMKRTRDSCFAIIPTEKHSRCKELPCLREVSPIENLLNLNIGAKTKEFERWLVASGHKRVVVVGHSKYLNKLLGSKEMMRNCDLWQATVTFTVPVTLSRPADGATVPSSSSSSSSTTTIAATAVAGVVSTTAAAAHNPADAIRVDAGDEAQNVQIEGEARVKWDKYTCKWSSPQLLHRTALSEAHPLDDLLSALPFSRSTHKNTNNKNSSSNNSATANSGSADRTVNGKEDKEDEDEAELDESEPMCRICQCTEREAPNQRLFKPCKCTGSVSFVHVHCLDRWRATSAEAYYTCSVCKYPYQIQRTVFAKLLMDETFVLVFSGLLVVLSILVLGALTNTIAYTAMGDRNDAKLSERIFQVMEVRAWWDQCTPVDLPAVLRSVYIHHMAGATANGEYGGISFVKVTKLIQTYVRIIFKSSLLVQYFGCREGFAQLMHTVTVGAAVVALTGFGLYLAKEIQRLRANANNRAVQAHLVMVVIWFFSLGNKALGRLGLLLGCGIALREVYGIALVRARQASQWMGDRILEPN